MESRSPLIVANLVVHAIETTAIPEIQAIEDCGPLSPSEDFAYYTKERPCCFFYVGAQPVNKPVYPHHHPKFDIEEDAMIISAKAMGAATLAYLK